MSDLVGNLEDGFCRDAVHIIQIECTCSIRANGTDTTVVIIQ